MCTKSKRSGYVKDLQGMVIDKLTVVSFKEVIKTGNSSVAIWNCVCECGNEVEKRSSYLTRKTTFSSCGCYSSKGVSKKESSLLWGFGINDIQNLTQKEIKCLTTGKRKVVWRCPYYQKWMSMVRRCYSKVHHSKAPSYRDCYVCEEWKYFSNFKSWMEKQDWEGKELDKDLIEQGNKVYSPENVYSYLQQ